MAYDTTTAVVDDVNDNLAVYHNELKTAVEHLMSASSYASYVRTQSMTANVTLADADLPIQSFSPTAARDLTLPAVASTNHPFYVWNRSGAYAITVKNASAVVIAVLQPYSHVTLQTDGANGWYVIGTSERETVYKFAPTVASNDLILTLTHMDGTTPSAERPLWFHIADAWRAVTGALAVTVADGTNTFNAGSAELATKEVDYFPYVSWRTASSAVVLGFSRIPFASLYSDFSGTATDEKYAAFSTAPASGDDVVNIGRFAATLSAGAGYTWTVPTFTNKNLIQRPCFETRWLDYQPAYSANGSMTFTTVTTNIARYKLDEETLNAWVKATGTTGGTANTQIWATVPFEASQISLTPQGWGSAAGLAARVSVIAGTPDIMAVSKYDLANYALSAGTVISGQVIYEI